MKTCWNHLPPAHHGGFSLLEVILALAILAGAIAVLGELSRLGMDSARIARDGTYAQLLCESKLAEITAGLARCEPEQEIPFGTVADRGEPDWLYSIDVTPVDEQGLVEVRVTVTQDLPLEKRPVEFSLVRWMVDPSVESSDAVTEEAGSEVLETGDAL